MANKHHTNQFWKRALALTLAVVMAIGSWSIDWNSLGVKAAGFDTPGGWLTSAGTEFQDYQNTSAGYEKITDLTLHVADMYQGDVVSFYVEVRDYDTSEVLYSGTSASITAVQDVTFSNVGVVLPQNKTVTIGVTCQGEAELYTDGQGYVDITTTAIEPPSGAQVTIDASNSTTILVMGQTGQVVATESTYGRAIQYSSNKTDVLMIDENTGVITPKGPGKATVTAKTGITGDVEATIDVTVVQVTVGSTSLTYTGLAQTPTVTVTAESALTEGEDYSVSGSATNVGDTAELVVEGLGTYAGFRYSTDFSVSTPVDIDTLSGAQYTIDTKTSEVTAVTGLKLANGYQLVYGTDFTATAERTGDDSSEGAYKHVYEVTLTGQGNFSGTKVETCKVTADVSTLLSEAYTIEFDDSEQLFAGEANRAAVLDKIIIKNKRGAVVNKNLFTITLSDEELNTPGKITVKATYPNLYAGEISVDFLLYGNIRNATVTVENQKWVYTGNSIMPNVTVTLGTKVLTKDTDYTVSYSNNREITNAATIQVTGRDPYTGSASVTFEIVPSLQDATVKVENSTTLAKKSNNFVSGYHVDYSGSAKEPTLEVKVNGTTLTKNDHYTVTYNNNTEASNEEKASAVITTKDTSPCGVQTLTVYFTIDPLELNSSNTTWTVADAVYSGEELTPDVTLKRSGVLLTKGTDYELEYSNNKDASAYAIVTATGKGNYTGTTIKNFTIQKKDISAAEVIFEDSYSYTGSAIVPEDGPKSVKLNGVTLTKGEDYLADISYTNNVRIGTATGTITGTGNYKGTASGTFQIVARSILGPQITFYIAGSEQVPAETMEVTETAGGKVATYHAAYSAVYRGRPTPPGLTIKDGDKSIQAGVDYTVTSGSNVNAGEVTIEIKGKGNYANTGTVHIVYTITPCDIADESRIIIDTSALVPGTDSSVKVTDNKRKTTTNTGEMTQGSDKDYTVSWGDWTSTTPAGPNKALTITGSGNNYTGTRTVTYTQGINLEEKGLLEVCDYLTANGLSRNGDYSGAPLYQVHYYGGQTMDAMLPEFHVTDTTQDTETRLTAGTDYTTEVAAVVSDGYSAGSIVKVTATAASTSTKYYGSTVAYYKILPVSLDARNFTLKFADDNDNASVSDGKFVKHYDYTGSTITPSFVLTYAPIALYGSKTLPTRTLVVGTDYTNDTLTIDGAVRGDKLANLKGLGPNFVDTSSVQINYTVGQANIADAKVATIAAQEYTKSAIEPTPAVTYNGKTLKAGTDFTYSYDNNVNETTSTSPAKVIITGMGNYTGTKEVTFEITRKKFANDGKTRVVFANTAMKYTGSAITLSEDDISVYYENKKLTYGTDYVIDFGSHDHTNPGKAEFTLTTGSNGLIGVDSSNPFSASFDIYLDLADTAKYVLEGVPDEKEVVYYGETIGWKVKGTDTAFKTDDIKIKTTATNYYLPTSSYALLTSNLTQGTKSGYITVNGAGHAKYCQGSTRVDDIHVYIDASLLTIEGFTSAYPFTGLVVKPGTTSTLRVYYGSRELTNGTEFSFGYKGLSSADYTSVNLRAAAVYLRGNESQMYTGVSQDYEYSIKYDLSQATAEGWVGTYKYDEIQTAAARDGVTEGNYRPVPTMVYIASSGSRYLIPRASFGLEYASSKGNGATFNDNGAIVSVLVKPESDDALCMNTKTLSYKVTGIEITQDNLEITLEKNSYPYTGSKIEPTITQVKLKNAVNPLSTTDYTVKYANNTDVTTESNPAKVIITGAGNYTGSATATFQITQKDIAEDGSSVEAVFPTVTYTGLPITADELSGLVLRDTATGKVLKPGTNADFTFSVKYGTEAGVETGCVHVEMNSGKNYTGSKDYKFDIEQLNLSNANLSVSGHSAEYTGKAVTPEVVLTMKVNGGSTPITLVENDTYVITYNGGNQMVDVGTYDMLIQPKPGNTNVTGSLSAKFTIFGRAIGTADYKLLKDNTSHKYKLTIGGEEYKEDMKLSYDFTGDPVKPAVVLIDPGYNDDNPLAQGVDYTVSYDPQDPIEATSQAKVIIEGIGNYSGRVEMTYTIGKDLQLGRIDLSDDAFRGFTYNGAEQKPETVKVYNKDGEELTAGTDYTLTYSDDLISAGTKTITATANPAAGYYGTVSTTYRIAPLDVTSLNSVKVVPDLPQDSNGDYYAEYTGAEICPEVEVYVDLNGNGKFADSEKLAETDYTVHYSNNVEAGVNNAYVDVELQGNYVTKHKYQPFTIRGSALSDTATTVIVNDLSYEYTGREITPSLTVYQNLSNGTRKALTENADYVIYKLENNINPGDAIVTIQGIGSFTGEVSKTFVISADLSTVFDLDVDGDGVKDNTCEVPQQLYTGAHLTPKADVTVGGTVLEDGVDYVIGRVSYTAYDSEGNPTAGTVDIIGNNKYYKNTYTASFSISTDLQQIELTYVGLDDVVYSGSAQKQTGFTIYDPSGEEVTYEAKDVTYQSSSDGDKCVDVGTVTVTIPVRVGTIRGDVTKTYDITKANIASVSYTKPANSTYTGKALRPPVELKYRGKTLVAGTDYTIVYDNNTKPTSHTSTGETPAPATVTISGINNFEGSFYQEFQIYPERMRNLNQTASTANSVTLTWDKLSHVTGYRVDVKRIDDGTLVKTEDVKNADTTTATISGLQEGTSYSFRAYSYVTVEGKTYYGLLNSISLKTDISTPKITVQSNIAKKAKIQWLTTTSGVKYMIYRSDSANGPFTLIGITKTDATSFTDVGLTSGRTYYYQTRAFRYPSEYGEYSSVSAVTVK